MTDPSQVPPAATLSTHLDRYLVGRVPARLALIVLAFAEEPGLPVALWRSGTAALAAAGADVVADDVVTDEQLMGLARGPLTVGAVIEIGGPDGEGPVYRLSVAAADELRPGESAATAAIQRRLAAAWFAHGRRVGWDNAPDYLLRNLPRHALAADRIDPLLADDGYLAHADLDRLATAARHARTRAGLLRAALLESCPQAASVTGEARTAVLSVTDALDGLGTGTGSAAAPYHGLWAHVGSRAERGELTGHTDDVNAVCPVLVAEHPVLATGSSDGAVRLWDPVTPRLDRVLKGHSESVRALCPVDVGGRSLLASGGDDHTVRLWDPATGRVVLVLFGHTKPVIALCAVPAADRELLASAGENDRDVRLWDPATGLLVRVLAGHTDSVRALCAVPVDGGALVASASWDGTVRLWDPGDGRLVRLIECGDPITYGMCTVTVGGHVSLATACLHGTVRLWDPTTGKRAGTLDAGSAEALCPVVVAGRTLLAVAVAEAEYVHRVDLWDPVSGARLRELSGETGRIGAMREVTFGERAVLVTALADGEPWNFAPGDGVVRLLDPATGRWRPVSHGSGDLPGPVSAVAAVRVAGRDALASAGADHTVRLWGAADGRDVWVVKRHLSAVNDVCTVPSASDTLLASAGDRTVCLARPETGEVVTVLHGHTAMVAAVCPVPGEDQALLASGGYDRTVRLWDPGTGRTVRILEHPHGIYALTAVTVRGRTLLAAAGADGVVRLWDPATGESQGALAGHDGWICGLSTIESGGSTLLASAGSDGSVRLWDPGTGAPGRILTGHTGAVRGVCPVRVDGVTLLASAGADAHVRLWDPVSGRARIVISVRDPATACAEVAGNLIVGLDTGILAIRLGGGPG
jgi:WD40 repeat protein